MNIKRNQFAISSRVLIPTDLWGLGWFCHRPLCVATWPMWGESTKSRSWHRPCLRHKPWWMDPEDEVPIGPGCFLIFFWISWSFMSRKLGTSSQASPESSALREAALRAVRETQPDNTRDSETLKREKSMLKPADTFLCCFFPNFTLSMLFFVYALWGISFFFQLQWLLQMAR